MKGKIICCIHGTMQYLFDNAIDFACFASYKMTDRSTEYPVDYIWCKSYAKSKIIVGVNFHSSTYPCSTVLQKTVNYTKEKSPGRPKSAHIPENIDTMQEIVLETPQTSIRRVLHNM